MITIGIVGSRRRNTANDMVKTVATLDRFLNTLSQKEYRLVSGGCPQGADSFAEAIAKKRGLTITIHCPDWNGPAKKAAGFVRNTTIAEDCDVLIAVVAKDRTGGTEDTIRKAEKLGKQIILVE